MSTNFAYISRNHETLMVNTEKGNSTMFIEILKRLAEMFPKQDYQSRLEQYISTQYPKSAGDVEFLERQYYQKQKSGNYL